MDSGYTPRGVVWKIDALLDTDAPPLNTQNLRNEKIEDTYSNWQQNLIDLITLKRYTGLISERGEQRK